MKPDNFGNSLGDVISATTKHLRAGGIETAAFDARILVEAVTGLSRAQLISRSDLEISKEVRAQITNYVAQRISGKPVFRILGQREFFGRDFKVFDNVLDPRPETELLVELIVEQTSNVKRFAEIGVGSGAISVSLLCEIPNASALATDMSDEALIAARHNAKTHGVKNRLTLAKADCLSGVQGKFDFIVSNPPYIKSEDIEQLQIEVREFDPALALDGGKSGLEFYAKIFEQAHGLLVEGGKLYLETGHGQHDELAELGKKMGWGLVSKHLDLCGLERIVVFKETDV